VIHRAIVIIVLAVLVAGCASRARSRTYYYVRIAEALTAPTLYEGIRVAPRMFAASELSSACGPVRPVLRIHAAPPALELHVGDRFALNTLSVVAVNGAEVALPDVPIVLEANEVIPAVVQLRSDDSDLKEGRLFAIAPGRFQIRIRTICVTPTLETIIAGRVIP
jgi:hypothetical protein